MSEDAGILVNMRKSARTAFFLDFLIIILCRLERVISYFQCLHETTNLRLLF